jgi:hypothetical protein
MPVDRKAKPLTPIGRGKPHTGQRALYRAGKGAKALKAWRSLPKSAREEAKARNGDAGRPSYGTMRRGKGILLGRGVEGAAMAKLERMNSGPAARKAKVAKVAAKVTARHPETSRSASRAKAREIIRARKS